jgi:hypothetical protein
MYESPMLVIKENVYLYSLWNGELKIIEGDVYGSPYNHSDNVASFKTKRKRFMCSSEPGIVYNSVVWFPDRDDVSASKVLIEYHEAAIATLQDKIDNHLHKINILKEENHQWLMS